jgi:hypothetical protein
LSVNARTGVTCSILLDDPESVLPAGIKHAMSLSGKQITAAEARQFPTVERGDTRYVY